MVTTLQSHHYSPETQKPFEISLCVCLPSGTALIVSICPLFDVWMEKGNLGVITHLRLFLKTQLYLNGFQMSDDVSHRR